MTFFHFAYPNVLPRKEMFIGCGRYGVFTAGDTPSADYHEVLTAPNTPNKNNLKRAVQLLAPESYDSSNLLFHKQDQQEQTYQGDSLDLAWFLAHILRGRKLGLQTETDIWCTGVVQLDGSGPHLLDVHPDGFFLKLQAFLSSDNNDQLFIVPLANMEPGMRKMCLDAGAQLARLQSYESCNPGMITGKTILTIAADELASLIELLFVAPASHTSTGRNKKTIVISLLALAGIGVAGFAGFPFLKPLLQDRNTVSNPVSLPTQQKEPAPALVSNPQSVPVQPNSTADTSMENGMPVIIEPKSTSSSPVSPQYHATDIITEIRQGNFANLVSFLKSDANKGANKDTDDLQQLRQQADHELLLNAELQYQLAGGAQKNVALGKNIDSPVLTHNDVYRCQVRVDSPPERLYLYLLQADSAGSMTPLFPNPQFGTENPVTAGQWPITIPGREDDWLYLDQLLQSNTTGQQVTETLYLLASPWPADDIESLIRQKGNNQAGKENSDNTGDRENNKIASLLAERIALRRQAGVSAMVTIRWSFVHGE